MHLVLYKIDWTGNWRDSSCSSEKVVELSSLLKNVAFPNAAVLFLRHTKLTPKRLTIKLETSGGSVSYQVPIMKIQIYTIKVSAGAGRSDENHGRQSFGL